MSREEPRDFFKRFKVVLIEHLDSGWYSAQCLEYDIAVQAQGVNNVLLELERVLKGHIAVSKKMKVPPFKNLPKAPKKFWSVFEKANWQARVRYSPAPTRRVASQKPRTVLNYDVHISSSVAQLV